MFNKGAQKKHMSGHSGMGKEALFQLNKTFNNLFCLLSFQLSPFFSDTFKFTVSYYDFFPL